MILSIKEEKMEILNEYGDSNIVYMKVFRLFGIPVYKSSFIREIDTQHYTPPQESPKPTVVGFGNSRMEFGDTEESDEVMCKNKYKSVKNIQNPCKHKI